MPGEKVHAARLEELEFLRRFPVYEKVPEAEAHGKVIVDVRWVDVNKGDWDDVRVRSRLCAKEFKWKNPWLEDTFAGTPPWEAIKLVLSRAMTLTRGQGSRVRKKVLVLDISRAHFHPLVRRELYIRLPAEDAAPGMIGKLIHMMYGTRDAANGWEEFHREKLAGIGYGAGAASSCVFANREKASSGAAHGDDFVFEGEEPALLELEAGLRKHMIVQKKALLGPDAGDDKHCTILNRLISYEVGEQGVPLIKMEADPRHVEIIVQQMGIAGDGAKSVTTPGMRSPEFYDDNRCPQIIAEHTGAFVCGLGTWHRTRRTCSSRPTSAASTCPCPRWAAGPG